MAFINEYISDEDMEKYNIRSIWAKFDRIKSDEKRDLIMGRYSWTIDKSCDVFFIPVEWGREEFSSEITCVIYWQGYLLTVTIENIGSNIDYSNKTGERRWGLLDIKKPKDFLPANEEVISVLKDALTVYQVDGIFHPMLSFSVTFSF